MEKLIYLGTPYTMITVVRSDGSEVIVTDKDVIHVRTEKRKKKGRTS